MAGYGAPPPFLPPPPLGDGALCMLPPRAVVLYDFRPQAPQEVAVLVGDIVDCLAMDADRRWLYVRTLRNTTGYVPAAYCRFLAVVTPQPARRIPSASATFAGSSMTLNSALRSPTRPGLLLPSGPSFGRLGHSGSTLSPGSAASNSSGISTSCSNNSGADAAFDAKFTPDDVGTFSREAVAQYGSASGSSTSGSACERRIKMVKSNEQKKLLRARSADAFAFPAAEQTAQAKKPLDALRAAMSRPSAPACVVRRPPTSSSRPVTRQDSKKVTESKDACIRCSSNVPDLVLCETFV